MKRKKSLIGHTTEDWELGWQDYEDSSGKSFKEAEHTEVWKLRKRCKFYLDKGEKTKKVRITIEEI